MTKVVMHAHYSKLTLPYILLLLCFSIFSLFLVATCMVFSFPAHRLPLMWLLGQLMVCSSLLMTG